jgi:hypothetical protein
MEQNRINLHQGLVADGNYHKDINEFNSKYFSNDSTVKDLWEKLTKNSEYTKTLQQFYAKYACDLSWAKTTQYCGGSGGDNTNTSNYEIQWSKYPCVVELAKSKGVSISDNGSYLIGDFKYFAKGRKGILSTGKVTDFTCDDPEFKKSSSGSQSSGSQPVSGRKQPTQIPSELKDIDGVKKFQDWLDIYHPGWHRKYGVLNKNLLRGYGKYGPNTTRAWNNQSYKDEYLKTSNSTATPSIDKPSNWKDLFPSCVKGLKGFYNPPLNYFYGLGTDTKGVQYLIAYFSQELNQGRLCNIYKTDGTLVGNGFYSCTTNNQQITIKTLIGLSITGSVINPDYRDITSPKNDDEILEPSDDDVLMDYKTMVSKKTGM